MNSFRNTACGIFAIGAAIILFEIALTRVFAVMMWHHLTYMVISMALLGFGAAGSVLTLIPELPRRPNALLATLSSGFAVSAVLSLYFGTVIELDTLSLFADVRNVVALLLYYLVLSIPLFMGGLVVGLALKVHADRIHRLYFADLVGSAVGALLSVFALDQFGAVTTIHGAALIAAVSGLAFSRGQGWLNKILPIVTTMIMAVAVLGYAGGLPLIGLKHFEWPLPFGPGKEMAAIKSELVEKRLPSATAEVEVTGNMALLPFMGGEFALDTIREIEGRVVAQDGTAPTMLYAAAADLKRFQFLHDSQAGSGYVALEAAGKVAPKVLVVGVGGGVDVMLALVKNASAITAVEINNAMIRMVRDDYDAYLGQLFTRTEAPFDRIKLVAGEGRSYVRHSAEKFDLIQLSGVDSFTALNTGAYTLSESYLYTVEAIRDFVAHLNDGGLINYSRFIMPRNKRPRETLRLAAIARQALEEAGQADPSRSILVFQGRLWASTMIKKGEFSAAEVAALKTFAETRGFRGLVFNPLRDPQLDFDFEPPPHAALALYLRDVLRREAHALFPKGSDAEAAAILARHVLAIHQQTAAPTAELNEFLARQPAELREPARGIYMGILEPAVAELKLDANYFKETREDFRNLLQANAKDRAEFVAGYPYKLDACRDDDPFFFNYYRWDGLLHRDNEGIDNIYNPDFPVGHAVLLASLLQVGLLALVFILLPLRSLQLDQVETQGKLRYFTYFAGLGLGFMMVEIAIMQKLALLLGHPTLALAVVLGGLLFAAGLGSFLAEKLGHLQRWKIINLGLIITLAIVGTSYAISRYAPTLLAATLPLRILAALGFILPLGLAMGAAFPSGIRVLRRNSPRLVPWAWAINGFTSVLGSILAIVIAQEIGFEGVVRLSAGIYLLGFLLLPAELPAAPTTARPVEAQGTDDGHTQRDED